MNPKHETLNLKPRFLGLGFRVSVWFEPQSLQPGPTLTKNRSFADLEEGTVESSRGILSELGFRVIMLQGLRVRGLGFRVIMGQGLRVRGSVTVKVV